MKVYSPGVGGTTLVRLINLIVKVYSPGVRKSPHDFDNGIQGLNLHFFAPAIKFSASVSNGKGRTKLQGSLDEVELAQRARYDVVGACGKAEAEAGL